MFFDKRGVNLCKLRSVVCSVNLDHPTKKNYSNTLKKRGRIIFSFLVIAKDLFQLEKTIKEFEVFSNSIEKIEEALRSGRSRTYFIRDAGKIVSCASATAETSNSVMVIGVCTHPDFRGKGYASFCTAKLSYDMLKTAKRPCLFYDNPAAGKFLPQDRIQRDREMGFNCFVKII